MKKIITLPLMILGAFIWYYFFIKSNLFTNELIFFTDELGEINYNAIAYYGIGYLFLLFGIFIGTLCKLLIEKKKSGSNNVKIFKFIGQSFSSIELWISLFASPILYGTIINSITSISLGGFIFLSLQTGFSSYLAVGTLMLNSETSNTNPQDENENTAANNPYSDHS